MDSNTSVHKSQAQFATVTKFCTLAPNICGFLVWNLLHVTHLAPRNFKQLLHFSKFVHPWYFLPISLIMRTVKGTGYKVNRTGSGSDAIANFCASTVVLLSFNMGGGEVGNCSSLFYLQSF